MTTRPLTASQYADLSTAALRKEARRRSIDVGKADKERLISILLHNDEARAKHRAQMAADARYARAHAQDYVGKLVEIGGTCCHEVDGTIVYTYYQPGVVERVHSGTAWVRISEWEGRPGENHMAGKLAKVPIVDLCPRGGGDFRDILDLWCDEQEPAAAVPAAAAPAKPRRRQPRKSDPSQLALFA
jgi:hypothetical protein